MNDTQIKVSVIVPVYGVEKYIERCARSLFEQTMSHGIEFIFVNDCTPDNSIKILNDIIRQYPIRRNQVTIVNHNVNKGLPSARNSGLSIAKGEYIAHCDSDDWVEHSMYETMYNEAVKTNADIVGCSFFAEYENYNEVVNDDFNVVDYIQSCKNLLTCNRMHFNVWQRLIKKQLYVLNEITFDPRFSIGEDCLASLKLQLVARKFASVHAPLYHYRIASSSSMIKSMTRRGIDDISLMLSKAEKEIIKHNLFPDLKLYFYRLCLVQKNNLTFKYKVADIKWYQSFRPEVNKHLWSLPHLTITNKIICSFTNIGLPQLTLAFYSIKNLLRLPKH